MGTRRERKHRNDNARERKRRNGNGTDKEEKAQRSGERRTMRKSKRIDLLLPEKNTSSRRLHTVDEKGGRFYQRLQGYEAVLYNGRPVSTVHGPDDPW